MNRERKYKIWTGSEMIVPGHKAYDECYINLDGIVVLVWVDSNSGDTFYQEKKDWKVLEYTGLKDSNAVEWSEGDVIGGREKIYGFIVFVEGKFMLQYQMTGFWPYIDISDKHLQYLTVKGNIHEDPDLVN